MSALTRDILITLFVVFTLFITPDMVVTYSRDRLLSLRNHTAYLTKVNVYWQWHHSSAYVDEAAAPEPTADVVYRLPISTTRTSTRGEIPTIIGHRIAFVNKYQLIDAQRDPDRANQLVSY